MSDLKLPPLPNPEVYEHTGDIKDINYFTAKTLREYATAAVEAAEASHREELRAYELTVDSLRAQRGEPERQPMDKEHQDAIVDAAIASPWSYVRNIRWAIEATERHHGIGKP